MPGGAARVDPSCFVAPGAQLIGDVSLEAGSSVWFNAVIRADNAAIRIGKRSNIQDLSMVHCDPGFPATVGDGVTVGHGCIIHGCTIGDDVLVGMGSVIMNGCIIGRGSIVAAGAVCLEGFECPPFSLVTGSPAKIKKNYGEGILDKTRFGAASYAARAKSYKRNLASSSGGGGGAAASSSMSMVTVGLLAAAATAAAMRAARL